MGGLRGRPAEVISVTSRGVRPGIMQGKAAKQRRRKQSLWPTAFSILSTRRNTWCFPVSFLWTFSGLMSAPIFLHGICRFRYFLVKILFSVYGCFQSNQILGFLSHFPKSAACSPARYRPENIFFLFASDSSFNMEMRKNSNLQSAKEHWFWNQHNLGVRLGSFCLQPFELPRVA